jgi:hypothetical protein
MKLMGRGGSNAKLREEERIFREHPGCARRGVTRIYTNFSKGGS